MSALQAIWDWLSDQGHQRTLAFIGGGLAVLVAGGWQLYVYLHPEKPGSSATGSHATSADGSQSVSTGQGDISGVIVGPGATVHDIQIQQGDSAQVRQQKLERAQGLLAAEVTANLRALDHRLTLVDAATQPDEFDAELSAVRRQVAPATEAQFAKGYEQLTSSSQVASLRHALNSERLRPDLPGPLLQVLLDAGASGEPVQTFYAGLTEVERVTDSLLTTLESAGQVDASDEAERTYAADSVALAQRLVRNRTQLAYLDGLRLLDTLGAAGVSADLSDIKSLEPRRPLAHKEYQGLLAPLAEEGERLVEQRRELVQRAATLRDAKLEEYRKLNEQLKIQPQDTWAIVVGKARALRELGRTGDAVAAFGRYAEMFAASDPGAPAYARTAQAFTTQFNALGVSGGVYLFAVTDGGAAAHAGLQVGDIIISYAGAPTPGPAEFSVVQSRYTAADTVRLDYLRLQPTGAFKPGTVSLPGGPLGAGLMPI